MKLEKKRLSDYDNSGNLGVTEMFGAIFYMLLGGLKKKYEHYYQVKFQRKNIITGYCITLFVVFGSIVLFYFLLV